MTHDRLCWLVSTSPKLAATYCLTLSRVLWTTAGAPAATSSRSPCKQHQHLRLLLLQAECSGYCRVPMHQQSGVHRLLTSPARWQRGCSGLAKGPCQQKPCHRVGDDAKHGQPHMRMPEEAAHLLRGGAGNDVLCLLLGEALLHRLGCIDATLIAYPDVHQSSRPRCLRLS